MGRHINAFRHWGFGGLAWVRSNILERRSSCVPLVPADGQLVLKGVPKGAPFVRAPLAQDANIRTKCCAKPSSKSLPCKWQKHFRPDSSCQCSHSLCPNRQALLVALNPRPTPNPKETKHHTGLPLVYIQLCTAPFRGYPAYARTTPRPPACLRTPANTPPPPDLQRSCSRTSSLCQSP